MEVGSGSSETMEVDDDGHVKDAEGLLLQNRSPRKLPDRLIRRKFGDESHVQNSFGSLGFQRRGVTLYERPPVDVFLGGPVDVGWSAKGIKDCVQRASRCYANDEQDYFTNLPSGRENFVVSRLVERAPEPLEDKDEFGEMVKDRELERGPSYLSKPSVKNDQGGQGEQVPSQHKGRIRVPTQTKNGIDLPGTEDRAAEEGPEENVLLRVMLRANTATLIGPEDEEMVRTGSIIVYRQDLATLRTDEGDGLLSDPVINLYLKLLQENCRNVFAFECACCKLLMETDGLQKMEEATNDGVNIFDYDVILFPVLKGAHWILVVAHIPERTIYSYNSAAGSDQASRNRIEEFMKEEAVRKSVPLSEWTKIGAELLPQQDNGHDCGVFLLQFARCICRREGFDFGPRDMPYFRERILYECSKQRLLPPN